jgi:hypothetical protein
MGNKRFTYGGFVYDNIRDWIVKECIESGNPEMFILAVEVVVSSLIQKLEDHPNWSE